VHRRGNIRSGPDRPADLGGLVFFGAAHAGYPRAFEESLAVLAVLLTGVAGGARLLPAATRQPA
jgi:hypothetical protein